MVMKGGKGEGGKEAMTVLKHFSPRAGIVSRHWGGRREKKITKKKKQKCSEKKGKHTILLSFSVLIHDIRRFEGDAMSLVPVSTAISTTSTKKIMIITKAKAEGDEAQQIVFHIYLFETQGTHSVITYRNAVKAKIKANCHSRTPVGDGCLYV